LIGCTSTARVWRYGPAMHPIVRFATFRAHPGEGQALADHLPHAASLVADAAGWEMVADWWTT
jgi:hypothetical protein